jgi:hypothetical protein
MIIDFNKREIMTPKHGLKWLAVFVLASASAFARDEQFLHNKTLELLEACCPDGSRIVRNVSKLGANVVGDFVVEIEGDDEEACVTGINTIVHEDNHAAHTFLGREALKEKFGRFSDEFYKWDYFYLKDGRFILVKKTPTFPSRELTAVIPEELRTFRFATYIDTDNAMQSTQLEGVYGLLDEMNSYYQGTKASFNLLPYFEKKGASANWHDYFQGVNGTFYGCLEFRFYFLKYLMFAKENHPDVYDGIMKNKGFLNAFLEVERNALELIRAYFDEKPEIYKRLESYGWKVHEDEQYLTINATGRNSRHMNFMGAYQLLNEEMKKPEYAEMVGIVEQNAKGWDPESPYAEAAEAMKETKDTDTQGGKVDVNAPRLDNRTSLEKIANLSDPAGDAGRPFIDLVHASVAKDEQGLLIRLRFADLPDELTFNQTGVKDNQMEYSWSVYFDLDGDGQDDYYLGYEHFKDPEAGLTKGGIAENAQLSLWKLKSDGAEMVDVRLRRQQNGNELVIDLPGCDFVNKISRKTQIHCKTFYTDGMKEYQDRLPD